MTFIMNVLRLLGLTLVAIFGGVFLIVLMWATNPSPPRQPVYIYSQQPSYSYTAPVYVPPHYTYHSTCTARSYSYGDTATSSVDCY